MFILHFLISFVCLVVTLPILYIITLWDSATAHSPSRKELNPSSQEDARFSGRCTSAYIFHSSCAIPLWDSATAHSPTAKELKLFSREKSCFSGLAVCKCSHIILPGLSLVCDSPILLNKSICQCILSVVYFYSERPPLCIEV